MSASKQQILNNIFHHAVAPLSANAKFFLIAYYLLIQNEQLFFDAKKLSKILSMPYASLLKAVRELETNGVVVLVNRPRDRGRPLREIRFVSELENELSQLGVEADNVVHLLCIPNATNHQWVHNNLTIRNRLLLLILHMLSNDIGVVEKLTFYQIASLASLKAGSLRSQLNKLERIGFLFKLIPGIKNATIFSRRPGTIWLNLGHPLFAQGKEIHNVILFCDIKNSIPRDGKSVSNLYLCSARLKNSLQRHSSRPRYTQNSGNKVSIQEIERLEELYASSTYETPTVFLREVSKTPELAGINFNGGLDDLSNVLPPSVFSGPRKSSIIGEALRREISSALTDRNPDVAHHLVSSMDLWVTEIINLRIGEAPSEDEMLCQAKRTIEHFLLCKLNTLGAGLHTEEEVEQEYQYMRAVLDGFIHSLTQDTLKFAEVLTGILEKHGINTAQCAINYRSCHVREFNKQQKSYFAANEKLTGIIQIIKQTNSQQNSIKNTLITDTLNQKGSSALLQDVVVTDATIETINEGQRQRIRHMLKINYAANKGIVIEALDKDAVS